MHVSELKRTPWVSVDWSALSSSFSVFVYEADIDKFVTNLFKEVARDFNIPYIRLRPILEYENGDFFSAKETLFKNMTAWAKTSNDLISLEKKLRIPVVF